MQGLSASHLFMPRSTLPRSRPAQPPPSSQGGGRERRARCGWTGVNEDLRFSQCAINFGLASWQKPRFPVATQPGTPLGAALLFYLLGGAPGVSSRVRKLGDSATASFLSSSGRRNAGLNYSKFYLLQI